MLMSEPDVTCVCVSYDTTKYPPKGFPSCLNNEMQCNANRCFFHREKGEEGKAFGWAEAEPRFFLPLPPLPVLMAHEQEVTDGWMGPSVCNAKETSTWALEERATCV